MPDIKAFGRTAWIEWLPVLAGLLFLFVPTFYNLATSQWTEDEYAHGPIILLVIIWLLFERRDVFINASNNAAPVTGIALLILGLMVYMVGRSQDIAILEIGSIIPVLSGILLAMRGWQGVTSCWFVLLFSVYLIPLPGIFVDGVTGPLKQHVSAFAEQILYVAGYPIARNGVTLTIGQYQLLVADACSGINSMFSLSAIGLIYLYLIHRSSWLYNGLIIASLIPIAFLANIARVVFLVLVTYYFGDEAGQGFVHGFSGMVLFMIALGLIFLLDAVLVRIINLRHSA